MSKIEWPSEEEKWMAIGYLAADGVVSSIEATVPLGKTLRFQREFRGLYDDEYPYEANKFGYQFRIYLQDTEGCPTFLYDHLDTQYKNRINDTEFIKELVLEYGFRFSKKPQPRWEIERKVQKKGEEALAAYKIGANHDRTFLRSMVRRMKSETRLVQPFVKVIEGVAQSKDSSKRVCTAIPETRLLADWYLLRLGWLGEEYVNRLLTERDSVLYDGIGLSPEKITDILWFNNGWISQQTPGIWKDQSIGHGADFIIISEGREYFIEIKTSKRKYPYFTLTASELQKMEEVDSRYFLIKVDNLERLTKDEAPTVTIFRSPFKYFFTPRMIKEATFAIGE